MVRNACACVPPETSDSELGGGGGSMICVLTSFPRWLWYKLIAENHFSESLSAGIFLFEGWVLLPHESQWLLTVQVFPRWRERSVWSGFSRSQFDVALFSLWPGGWVKLYEHGCSIYNHVAELWKAGFRPNWKVPCQKIRSDTVHWR